MAPSRSPPVGGLRIGQDVSIGYSSRTGSIVRLHLEETLTVLMLTFEASVALAPPAAKPSA